VLSWWSAVKRLSAPREYDKYRELVAEGLRAVNLLVAPSRAMLTQLERYYAPSTSAVVIPNGRSSDEFHPAPKESFILASGRVWDEGKNIALFQEIGAALRGPVYVAGDCAHPNGRTVQLDHVTVLGQVPEHELRTWFARAGIYASPARYEPFGLSVLEAALSGCALVLSDIETFHELWDQCAVFVDPDDPEEWVRQLNHLRANETLTAALGWRARSRALQFNPARMTEEYIRAYGRAARQYQPAAKRRLSDQDAVCVS
jgi:glycosyltransferase involved in cell wall biosynthesis